jgi:hypothetical protein
MKRNAVCIAVTAVALCATSCEERAPSEERAVSTPAKAAVINARTARPLTALLDSGNAAFRAQNYARAKDYYLRATQLDSTFSAGWFGVYMVEAKLGNDASAANAMERVKAQ